MNLPVKAYHVLRNLGPRFVARRIALSVKKRLGVTQRRYPSRPWANIDLNTILIDGVPGDLVGYTEYKRQHLPRFLFPFGAPPTISGTFPEADAARQPVLRARIALLKEDRCVYFFNQPSPEKIDWYHNPFDDTRGERIRVWCDIPDFTPSQGDPRVLWEPLRAAWAFDFARARARGWDEPLTELYWRWVDSWMDACPPFQGFQWKCGQESSVRFIAMMFGFWAMGVSEADAERRWVQMARLAWATAYRVSHHIGYAVSQNNNHALSEACGLILIAQLFPELRDSKEWDRIGRKVLAEGMRRQIYADGSYVQHSMNYHRVMVQVCTLALRIAEVSDRPFPRDLYERLGLATEFLIQMMDWTTGRTPNYGNNDGALVLPLSETHFADCRAAVQSAHYLVKRKLLFTPGAWDEETLWLHGEGALAASREAREPESRTFRAGGYFTLRQRDSWVMVRCHEYRDRPSQYDPLHMDLWWNGLNILEDRGTFRYYNPSDPAMESAFRSLTAHNAVAIDGCAPMEWVGRFLCVPFSHSQTQEYRIADGSSGPVVWAGTSYDYHHHPWHAVHHRIVICVSEKVWVIVEDLVGEGSHTATLRWQLPALPFSHEPMKTGVDVVTPRGPVSLRVVTDSRTALQSRVAVGLREGDDAVGFSAPFYNTLAPCPTFEVSTRGAFPLRLVTAVFLGCKPERASLRITGPARVEVGCGEQHWNLRLAERPWTENGEVVVVEPQTP